MDAVSGLTYSIPTPFRPAAGPADYEVELNGGVRSLPALTASFDSLDFDGVTALTGSQFIPAGPSGAVGPNHVVGAVNSAIRWSDKTGAAAVSLKLGNAGGIAGAFFDLAGAASDPTTPLHDPRVLFDQHAGRFVVVAMEQTTTPSNQSFIFVAVSQTSDPNGGWNFTRINSKVVISSVDTYADSPGLAVDSQAVYIGTNQFSFGNSFLGNRLFVLPKGIGAGGIYDVGGSSAPVTLNAVGGAGAPNMTYVPAHMFGNAPAGVGTWLVAYSAMSDGVNEFVGVIRVDNPLSSPTFNYQVLGIGDVDNTSIALPKANQSGTATEVGTGDDAALQAVWRNNHLYLTATVVPASGVDANQATAHWWKLGTSTLASLTVVDQGNLGGNSIAAAAHTFFPSIAVDANDNLAFGFSASAASIFPGAYYSARQGGDPPGTNQGNGTLHVGQAFYVRTLGTGENRWGGLSSVAIDPADGSFWLFNQYAMTQAPSGAERGRWATTWGRIQFDLIGPTVVAVGPVTPDPRNTSVSFVDITFSEPIRIDSFTVADISLTRNAANVTFSGNETFQLVGGNVYRVGGLAEETTSAGAYVLTVDATGVKDAVGNLGTGSAADAFVVDTTPPVVLQVGPVAPDPRNSPVFFVDVVFSELIDIATFGADDLNLIRDGNSVTFSGNETFVHVSGNTYRINGLTEETDLEGVYSLTVDTKFISDLAGNADNSDQSDSWTTDLTPPAILELDAVTPDPRNTAIASLGVKFTEAISAASFTMEDVTFLRNGFLVSFSGNESINQIDPQTYAIVGLAEETGLAGNYSLTVDVKTIQDLAGNIGDSAATETWVVDTTAPSILGVFFDGSTWSSAFRTAVGSSNGFPAQTGATQLQTMPWSTVNVIRIRFAENVSVQSGDIGIRGINVANYSISGFSYNATTFIASWTVSPAFDTDRVLIDLDGNLSTAVADLAGNKLAGTWTDGVSTFPTGGAAGVDFRFRFLVAVGDANRDGVVRNADLNLVRNNLFVDIGVGGYSVFLDIDANGQTRNADLNATRNHLFVDPPAGPGPTGAARSAARFGLHSPRANASFAYRAIGDVGGDRHDSRLMQRRLPKPATSVLDALFADS